MEKETKTKLVIKGTHCPSCKALIEDVCKELEGVKSCSVNYKSGEATIVHDARFDFKKFKKEVESLGKYKVERA